MDRAERQAAAAFDWPAESARAEASRQRRAESRALDLLAGALQGLLEERAAARRVDAPELRAGGSR